MPLPHPNSVQAVQQPDRLVGRNSAGWLFDGAVSIAVVIGDFWKAGILQASYLMMLYQLQWSSTISGNQEFCRLVI
jgi:hypothetical protein